MMSRFIFILVVLSVLSCGKEKTSKKTIPEKKKFVFKTYTQPSNGENKYENFNSPAAINKISEIENEYFNYYQHSCSKYYGTAWYSGAVCEIIYPDTITTFEKYVNELKARNETPDSMHCTIYAVEALKAGLDSNFQKLDEIHKKIWKDREYAGWSIGYILVKYFGWYAVLIVDSYSEDSKVCSRNFENRKVYNVWRQPDIPTKEMFILGSDDAKIDSLLLQNEFGWGFSYQGWHTWITRFDTLKECIWDGAPSKKYDYYDNPSLFRKTKFTDFGDYGIHVIVFPKLEDK